MNAQLSAFDPCVTAVSRRSVLKGIGGLSLAALLTAGLSTVARAEDLAPELETCAPPLFQEFLGEWAAAAASGDATRVARFYAEDAVFEDVPFNLVLQGWPAIGGFLGGFFANYAEASVTWKSVNATEHRATAEVIFAGKYVGQIPGLPSGSGQPVSVRSAHLYELSNGLIRRQTLYFDGYGLLIQLGALPAPEAPTEPSPTT
jgi:steroid delta-isomerase-like uncharacterized protein